MLGLMSTAGYSSTSSSAEQGGGVVGLFCSFDESKKRNTIPRSGVLLYVSRADRYKGTPTDNKRVRRRTNFALQC